MNCVLRCRKTGDVVYRVQDCAVTGCDITGSGMRLTVSPDAYDIEYTLDDVGDDTVDRYNPAPVFMGWPVDGKDAVNALVAARIAEKYPPGYEARLHRLKLSGKSSIGWAEYELFVEKLVDESNAFIAEHFGGRDD